MAGRESFFWHKLHSLTGIIPVGFYMVQHLTLNSFALAGPDAYNGVIQFFEHLPTHVLLVLKYGVVWLPLLFHAIYGFMIYSRADFYQSPQAASFRENKMFQFQRWSGAFAFVFLCYHMTTTSVAGAIKGPEGTIYYNIWANHLASFGYGVLVLYMLGILTCAYHLSYGIWNFCIRWGITISEAAQGTSLLVVAGEYAAAVSMKDAGAAGPFVAVIPDIRGHVGPADLAGKLRRTLGIET